MEGRGLDKLNSRLKLFTCRLLGVQCIQQNMTITKGVHILPDMGNSGFDQYQLLSNIVLSCKTAVVLLAHYAGESRGDYKDFTVVFQSVCQSSCRHLIFQTVLVMVWTIELNFIMKNYRSSSNALCVVFANTQPE